MYTEYANLPNNSRVWVYQANRFLTIEDLEFISAKAINFIDSWTRHGEDLKGSFTIRYNRFFILGVDENFNEVSGCSIDSSVRFIKELEKDLDIDLTDKLNVTFKYKENINLVKLSEFQDLTKQGEITSETIVFNNMVDNKQDFETKWEVAVKESWHNRFL